MSDIDQGTLGDKLSNSMPPSLVVATEYDNSWIACLSIDGKGQITFQLLEPGSADIDLAVLTYWGVSPAMSGAYSGPDQIASAGLHTELASFISGPQSTRASSQSVGQIPSVRSLYGDSLTVAAGGDKELKFNASSTALAKFVNKQAQLEKSLKNALLEASPPLTFDEAEDARDIYDKMLAHQLRWYFHETPQAKNSQDEAVSLFKSLQCRWFSDGGGVGKIHKEITTILPHDKWPQTAENHPGALWCITTMMIMSVCKHGRETMAPDRRMELATLARIGQQSNRIWMNGYEELYHPKYDV